MDAEEEIARNGETRWSVNSVAVCYNKSMNWQQPIPRSYVQMAPDEVVAKIVVARKEQLGKKLVILGHHYQQDNVIRFADVVGDSFQLSRDAAKLTEAEYVIFCGVHFMAESADILTGDHQKVILPDLGAGCSMADMAKLEDVEDAWEAITEASKDIEGFRLVPITYMNSSAAIKAFVGEHGGAVCTSSNCEKILRWALAQRPEGHASAGVPVQAKVNEGAELGASGTCRPFSVRGKDGKSSSSPISTWAATRPTRWAIRWMR